MSNHLRPVTLRPDLRRSLPGLVFLALFAGFWFWVASNLWAVHDQRGAAVIGAVGVAILVAEALYFANARVVLDEREITKRDMFGLAKACGRDQLASVEIRYTPQPTICFLRADGSLIFRLNKAWWTDSQVEQFKRYVSAR